jgi:hypothetical protein
VPTLARLFPVFQFDCLDSFPGEELNNKKKKSNNTMTAAAAATAAAYLLINISC